MGLHGAEDDEGIEILTARTFGSDAQKAFNLTQGADGVPVAEICDENSKLRTLVAGLSHDKKVLRDVLRRRL